MALARAVAVAAWREIRTLGSVQGNNFFWFVLLISMQPEAGAFLWLILGALLIVPALTAPFAKIPEIRLALWPVEDWQRRGLGFFTEPEARSSPWLWRLLPILEFRQIARSLDFWLAVLFAVLATAYRFFTEKPDPSAYPILAMLVVLSLSTLAQNVFAMDGLSGRMRWKVSPQRGWRVLWRKGWPLIAISVVLDAALSPVGALAGMLAALAIGNHSAVLAPIDSGAWRFSMGRMFPHGLLQTIGMFSCGIAAARGDGFYLGLAAAAYVVSTFFYGWVLERT